MCCLLPPVHDFTTFPAPLPCRAGHAYKNLEGICVDRGLTVEQAGARGPRGLAESEKLEKSPHQSTVYYIWMVALHLAV